MMRYLFTLFAMMIVTLYYISPEMGKKVMYVITKDEDYKPVKKQIVKYDRAEEYQLCQ